MQQQESSSLILKGGGLILTPCYSSKLKILTTCNSLMLNSANYLVGQVLCCAILAQHMYSVLWSWETCHLNMLNIWQFAGFKHCLLFILKWDAYLHCVRKLFPSLSSVGFNLSLPYFVSNFLLVLFQSHVTA